MSKIWNRPVTWLALFVSGVGALLMAIFGIHEYMTATVTHLAPRATECAIGHKLGSAATMG